MTRLQADDLHHLRPQPPASPEWEAYASLQREAAAFLGRSHLLADTESALTQLGLSAEQTDALRAALRALRATTQALEQAHDRITATLLNYPALLQTGVREQMLVGAERRLAMLSTIPHLDSKAVAKLIGSTAGNAAATAARLKARQQVFSVTGSGGQELFPAYQFDPITGVPRSAIKAVLAAFPAGTSGWALSFWFFAPNGYLNGARPYEQLPIAPESVIAAATHGQETLDF